MLTPLLTAAGIILLLLVLAAVNYIHLTNKHRKELEQELTEYRRFVAEQKRAHLDYEPVEPHADGLDCLVDHKRGHQERKGP